MLLQERREALGISLGPTYPSEQITRILKSLLFRVSASQGRGAGGRLRRREMYGCGGRRGVRCHCFPG